MKKTACLITCLALVAGTVYAQTTPQTQPTPQTQSQTQNQDPRPLSDKTMSTRLQQDMTKRNSSIGNNPVSWYDAGYGYYGTYSLNNQNYMARYDRNGNYVETLTRREWNDQIPQTTRDAFGQSEYGSQRVTAYWEVTDPGKKGSYYELSDATGKTSRVWADGTGKFSNQPAGPSTPQRP